MPSPTGPRYPTIAADSGGTNSVWQNPSNALAVDGLSATATFLNGGDAANTLYLTGFGFSIPATAVIDGIQMDYLRSGVAAGPGGIVLTKDSGATFSTALTDYNNDFWSTEAWFTYGGPTQLWGRTWTPAEINASGFGVGIGASNTHGGGSASVNAARITVYWHTAPTDVPKRYLYKVFSGSTYIGNLPNVISEFGFPQDINTAGAQLSIECAISADTSRQATDTLTDEAGNILTDEASNTLTTEGGIPIVAPGNVLTSALIKNGNAIEVTEFSYYWPNGKVMFRGTMERWEAGFGGEGADSVKILCYTDGQDLDNYLVRGNPYTYTADQSQPNQNANDYVTTYPTGYAGWQKFGQTWTVGTGVTNVGAIAIWLNGTANVTVSVYDGPAMMKLLGSVTGAVSISTPAAYQFNFPLSIPVVAGRSYFFSVSTDPGQTCSIYYLSTSGYPGGQMYASMYSGSSGGSFSLYGGDLLFTTYSGTGATIGTFTNVDPSTGMLKTVMDDYNSRGGDIVYTPTSIDATGLSLSYGFNTNTALEAIKAALSMAPAGFYWYVDVGTNTLYFKRANTVADFVLTKGRHLEKISLVSTIESVKNQVYFTGGAISGVNLYRTYSDNTSINLYKPRLDRKTDNRVTINSTADAIGLSAVAEQKDESYQTVVTIPDKTMDTTLIKPGHVMGFNGFGTFVDNILVQVARIDYSPSEVTLTLGVLPKRMVPEFERVTRSLIAEQTIANPTSPS